METSLKTGFAQIFSCCPKNLSCPKFGGAAAPLAPLARTPMSGIMENLLYVNSVVNPSRETRQKRRPFYFSDAQDSSNESFERV